MGVSASRTGRKTGRQQNPDRRHDYAREGGQRKELSGNLDGCGLITFRLVVREVLDEIFVFGPVVNAAQTAGK